VRGVRRPRAVQIRHQTARKCRLAGRYGACYIVGMERIAAVALSFFLATGCASVAKVEKVAMGPPSEAAMELECMADCLDESDASCDDCAARCFAPPPGVLIGLR